MKKRYEVVNLGKFWGVFDNERQLYVSTHYTKVRAETKAGELNR
jgi:hypothetical protein